MHSKAGVGDHGFITILPARRKSAADIAVVGHFNVRVINKDRTLAHDTGLIRNVVTRSGIESMLYLIAGGESMIDTAASYGPQTFYKFCLGTGAAPVWTDNALPYELTDAAYIAPGVGDIVAGSGTIVIAGTKTEASTLTMRTTFADPFIDAPRTISNIGVKGDADDSILAGSYFTGVAVTTTQEVQATYIISLSQA